MAHQTEFLIERMKEEKAKAKAATTKALDSLGLEAVLSTDKLDGKLAKYVVMMEATPRGLAAYAQKVREQADLVDKMLSSEDLMVQMLVADGAKGGNYGRALEIYSDIWKASDHVGEGPLQRLALAIALEHAEPRPQRSAVADADAPKYVDPVERYLHFEKALADGELDPAFSYLTVWDLRMVVDGEEYNPHPPPTDPDLDYQQFEMTDLGS